MRYWTRAALALVTALAVLVAGTSVSAAQDEEERTESEDSSVLGPAVAAAVIAGVETHDFGNNYVLLDSSDVGGPAYNSPAYNPTTVSTVSDTNDGDELVNLGFAFELYDVAYAQVYIQANGILMFGGDTGSWINADLATNDTVPYAAVFPYWDDLRPNGSLEGEVRYGTFGAPGQRVFVVKYDDVYLQGGETSGVTFEVRLFETSNAIEFHYTDMVWGNGDHDFGASATVGIRAAGGAGSPYLQYSNNLPQINNGLAVRLWQPTCYGQVATIVGDRGDDLLDGSAVDDVIYGHHGDDTITGDTGRNLLCGSNGADTLTGGPDSDYMIGGPGDDFMSGGLGVDIMFGQGGNDAMAGEGGSDYMWGGDGHDGMSGFSGADRMYGGDGDDILLGQGGQDFMWGEGGDDVMQGNWQSDHMYGGDGDDIMRGAGGKDLLYGEAGNDMLYGGLNTDYLDGGTGADVADGQLGRDNGYPTGPVIEGVAGCVAETQVSC